jgi:multimeric flavodoxin WrbA
VNVIVVMGSPRRNGKTAALVREVVRGAEAAGHTVKQYDVNDMNVRGCQGCRECRNRGTDCILDDDLKPYWRDLHEAGALVVAAPNYAATVCGPMITYMNRHFCILDPNGKSRLRPGLRLIGLFSQGNPDREKYLGAYDWYLKDFEHRDMVRHGVVINAGRSPDADPEQLTLAYRLGNTL